MATANPDAIFIKLGVLEISAYGHIAIFAVVTLAMMLVAARMFLATRRRRR
jgi:hypothetical protein